jgi:hypothetical protein
MKINDCRVNKDDIENIEIAMDSSTISIYSNSFQHHKTNVEKRKYNYLAQVRKLHITINIMNKEVMAMRDTSAALRDSVSACSMLEEMDNKRNILSLRADAFYDATIVYKICKELNIKPIIRPIKRAIVYKKRVVYRKGTTTSKLYNLVKTMRMV